MFPSASGLFRLPQTAGNEIKDIVRPIGEEKVFAKNVNSCFIGTGFEDWLRESGDFGLRDMC